MTTATGGARPAWGRQDVLGVCAAVGWFLARFLRGWSAQRVPHPDAAAMLVPMLGLLRQNPVLLSRAVTADVFGLRLPLMFNAYHGPYEGYLSLPFLILLGNTMRAIVARDAFFGALTVFAVYRCARSLFGSRPAAFAAAMLLSGSAWFVLACRFGIFDGLCVVPMGLLALADLVEWREEGKAGPLLRVAAWLGLGCATRLWFCAVPLAVAVAGALLWRPAAEPLWAAGRRRPGLLAGCLAVFLVWWLPFWLANSGGGWYSLRILAQRGRGNLAAASWMSVAARQARARWWQIKNLDTGWSWCELLTGSDLGVTQPPFGIPTFLLFSCVVLAVSGALSLRLERSDGWALRRVGLLVIVFLVDVLLSALSPTDALPHHLYPVFPLLYVLAAASPLCFSAPRARRLAWLAVGAVFLASSVQSAVILGRARRGLESTGGIGVESSSAVRDMARWLERRAQDRPVIMSERDFADNLLYFSAGRLNPIRFSWDEGARRFADPQAVSERLASGRNDIYLFAYCHQPCPFPDQIGQDTLPAFERLVSGAGASARRLRSFKSRDGQVVFEAYSVSR